MLRDDMQEKTHAQFAFLHPDAKCTQHIHRTLPLLQWQLRCHGIVSGGAAPPLELGMKTRLVNEELDIIR